MGGFYPHYDCKMYTLTVRFFQFIPYRRPRWFNPMGQVYIAQVVVFMGFISGSVPVTQTEASLWSPVWAGAVVSLVN